MQSSQASLQQLWLNDTRLTVDETISLNSSVPGIVESLLLALPTVAQIDLRHYQLVFSRLCLSKNMALWTDDAASANEIILAIVQATSSRRD